MVRLIASLRWRLGFGVPISIISIVDEDRIWFKSLHPAVFGLARMLDRLFDRRGTTPEQRP
ncbi:MAG: hypothetical protein Q7T68_04370 [Sphingopyxis sp.]|nr:hypothetical protein [Sphingopyxis sp.]